MDRRYESPPPRSQRRLARSATGLLLSLVLVGASLSVAPVWAQEEAASEPAQDTPMRATLHVESSPDGAAVLINGRRLGVTPFTITLPSQRDVVVRVELDGHEPWTETIELEPDDERTLTVELEPTDIE